MARQPKYWNRHHVKTVTDNARKMWGTGWHMLSNTAKEHAIKAEVAGLVLVQDESTTFNSAVVWDLYSAALRAEGLLD